MGKVVDEKARELIKKSFRRMAIIVRVSPDKELEKYISGEIGEMWQMIMDMDDEAFNAWSNFEMAIAGIEEVVREHENGK